MAEHRDIMQTLEMLGTITADKAIISDFPGLTNQTKEVKAYMDALPGLAEQAKQAAAMIREVYSSKEGEGLTTVWEDDQTAEYLTRGGTWQIRHLGKEAYVKCDVEGIFEMLKVDFLVESGIVDKYSNDLMTLFEIEVQQKARIARQFKIFLKNTRKTLEKRRTSAMSEEN